MDVDKAIGVWNHICSAQDKINTSDPLLVKLASDNGSPVENDMTIVSGVSYGSSFVGMVHIIKSEASGIGTPEAIAAQVSEKLKLGGWLENASGGFGIDAGIMDEVKKMLSTQSVSSHVSLIVVGAVPSIASSELKMGIKTLMQPNAETMNACILSLSQSAVDGNSISAGAEEAKAGNRLVKMQNAATQSLIRSLGEIDHGSNKVLGINSLMSAFESYLTAIKDSMVGVPINFYLKKITKSQLINWWIEKYYPGKKRKTSSIPQTN